MLVIAAPLKTGDGLAVERFEAKRLNV